MFVCAIWAFIGTFVTYAAAVQYHLGWWLAPIGAVVFGAIAWLFCNIREVGRALRYAWRKTITRQTHWRLLAKAVTYGTLGPAATVFTGLAALFALDVYLSGKLKFWFVPLLFLGGTLVFWFLEMSILVLVGLPRGDADKLLADHKQLFKSINPFQVYVVSLSLLAKRVPGGIIRFAKAFFLYLHREERRICFTATAIGVLAGFTACRQSGMALFGSVIGGAVGYFISLLEVRLVARRWLKVLPAPART